MKQIYSGTASRTFGTIIGTRYTYLILLASLFILIFTATSSSLEITEVELNPEDSDSGNEWIELYSEQEVNLSEYTFQNGDGGIYESTEKFSGYFILTFEWQWLDNKDEKILIKLINETIDETILLSDSRNNNFTWEKCNGEWDFRPTTKGEKNDCEEPSEEEDNNNESNQENQETQNTETPAMQDNKQEESQNQTAPNKNESQETPENRSDSQDKIVLNAPSSQEKQTYLSKEARFRIWLLYGFAALCIILIIALAWNKL